MLRFRLGRRSRLLLMAAVCATAFAVPSAAQAGQGTGPTKHAMKLNGQSPELNKPGGDQGQLSRSKAASNGITYHGGPVIVGTTNVYVIWYGNWPAASSTQPILTNLLSSIGGSPYFNINTTYYNGQNIRVSNSVSYKGATTDSYSHGTSLSDAGVLGVVASSLGSSLPDPNGLYFVLTSSDVSETSGFLTQYCGWHSHGSVNGRDTKYSFVGDASRNLGVCAQQTSSSPNDNPAADAMASVVAHELEETTTDPDLNAWYDSRGYENADKCAWTFGTTYNPGNGSLANMALGGRNYLIQRNWVNANGGSCALRY